MTGMAVAGRKGTFCLTVDNLGEALAVGRGRAARPDPEDQSIRVGVPAFLDLFADLQLRSTFFVEGWNALHHANVIKRIAGAGHEIGLHGWLHEHWAEDLDDRTREQLLWDGTAALRLAGLSPVAFRAPGGYRGNRTLETLGELGYRIDSSIDAGRGAEGEAPELAALPGRDRVDSLDLRHDRPLALRVCSSGTSASGRRRRALDWARRRRCRPRRARHADRPPVRQWRRPHTDESAASGA